MSAHRCTTHKFSKTWLKSDSCMTAWARSLPAPICYVQKIDAMARFLRAIIHPDGEIPLFNDSVLVGARTVRQLLAMIESPESTKAESEPHTVVFPESGYGVIRSAEELEAGSSSIAVRSGRIISRATDTATC